MRLITEKAREFGPYILFNNVLGMMQMTSLDEQVFFFFMIYIIVKILFFFV
jgi:hypothetical protein